MTHTIEQVCNSIQENYDNSVAKAFVLAISKLLNDSGIDIHLTQHELECIEETKGNSTSWKRTIALDFTDLDTSKHDAKIRADAIDEFYANCKEKYWFSSDFMNFFDEISEKLKEQNNETN